MIRTDRCQNFVTLVKTPFVKSNIKHISVTSLINSMSSEENAIEEGLNNTQVSCTVNPPESPRQTIGDEEKDEESESDSYISETAWPEFDIPGTWGNYGVENDPWNDSEKPVVRFGKYEDIKLTEEEQKGTLTERIIASCSSYLDKCPQTGKYVLCKCDLSNKGLVNISILMFHHYLQYLNLSGNNLTNLEPLGQLPFLMYLDVSHNTLTDLMDFKAPFNLTYVNFSHNYVDIISNLSSFWSIVHLDLSYNQIYEISGLNKLLYLKHLDLSYNKINCLKNLNRLKLTYLNLEHNQINTYEGIESCLCTLDHLITINLSHNSLTTLRLFEGIKVLQKLDMTDNNINFLFELESLKMSRYLTEVDFRENPICKLPNYYEVCLNCIKTIVSLDGQYIPAEDKVLATTKFKPPIEIFSGKNLSDLFLLEQLTSFDITNTVLPIGKPAPPMIILVGPPGSGQKLFIQEFYANNRDKLRLGISHTTRPKNSNETEGESYYFVSDEVFEEMVRNAEFITVSSILGYTYGFSYKELMKCGEDELVLLFHTDLIGALNIRKRNLNPCLVLTMYLNIDYYQTELVKKYYYTYWLSRNYKALRIINDSGRINSSSSSHVTSEIEEIVKELVATLPLKEYSSFKKSSVKFMEPIPIKKDSLSYSETSLESDPQDTDSIACSDEMISFLISKKRDTGSSFNLTEDDVFHSISEVEFDFEPILSVVSNHIFDEDTDDSLHRNVKLLKPSQRIENFIKSVLSTRNEYMDFHTKNPGIFSETIFTEKREESMRKLEALLKEIFKRKNTPRHRYTCESDPLFEEIVSDKLRSLHSDIQKAMFNCDDKHTDIRYNL